MESHSDAPAVPELCRWRTLATNLGLSLASLLCCFLLLEFGCRVYLTQIADPETFKKYGSIQQITRSRRDDMPNAYVYMPHRYLGYVTTPNYRVRRKDPYDRHNALGYRGDEIAVPKPPGVYRIVCLGGSTTYSVCVHDYHYSYPYTLGKTLREMGYTNVDVVNAGVSSYSSWETLLQFQLRVLDIEPDMVIVNDGINDVDPRLVWPPSAYVGDNSGRRRDPVDLALHRPTLIERSTLFRMLLIRAGLLRSPNHFESTVDRFPPTYYGDLFYRQVLQGRYPSGFFKKVSARQMLEANKPIYFRRNTENLVAIAKARGIAVVLSTAAYTTRDFPGYPRTRPSTPEYVLGLEQANEITRSVAQEMGVHLFDFQRAMPDEEIWWYVDGVHLSPLGEELKGKLYAAFVAEQGLVPKPASAAIPEASPQENHSVP